MGVQLLFLACVEALCDASVKQGKSEARDVNCCACVPIAGRLYEMHCLDKKGKVYEVVLAMWREAWP